MSHSSFLINFVIYHAAHYFHGFKDECHGESFTQPDHLIPNTPVYLFQQSLNRFWAGSTSVCRISSQTNKSDELKALLSARFPKVRIVVYVYSYNVYIDTGWHFEVNQPPRSNTPSSEMDRPTETVYHFLVLPYTFAG